MNSNAALDEYIRRPVALSLRAAGGYQDETWNKDLFKNLRPGHEGEDLFEVSRLDLWDFPNSPDRFRLYHPVQLNPSGSWLRDVVDATRDERRSKEHGQLKFRLLLTHAPLEYRWPFRPKIHDLSGAGHKQIYYAPFILKDMKKLIRGFHLPRDWLYLRLHAKGPGNFFRKTEWDFETGVAQRIGFVINFPFVLSPSRRYTGPSRRPEKELNSAVDSQEEEAIVEKIRNGDPYIWSVACSFNLAESTTTGIFDGVTEWTTDDLCERLQTDNALWSSHPLYLPMVLLDMYTGFAAMEGKSLDVKEHSLEAKSRKDLDVIEKYINRFGDHSRNLANLQRMLDFSLKLVNFLTETLKYLEDPKVLPRYWQTSAGEDGGRQKVYFDCVNIQMSESLMNTSYFLQNQLHRCKCLQKRAADELGVIQALYNQQSALDSIKIAKDSHRSSLASNDIADASKSLAYDAKQDSTSMMTISILTLAFLPATFIAAIFSTGFFDWQQRGSSIVSPHFWIYWAVSIPLTIAIMVAWFTWFYKYRKPRMEQDRARNDCEECRRIKTLKGDQNRFCPDHGPRNMAEKPMPVATVKGWRRFIPQFTLSFGIGSMRHVRLASDPSRDPESGLRQLRLPSQVQQRGYDNPLPHLPREEENGS